MNFLLHHILKINPILAGMLLSEDINPFLSVKSDFVYFCCLVSCFLQFDMFSCGFSYICYKYIDLDQSEASPPLCL